MADDGSKFGIEGNIVGGLGESLNGVVDAITKNGGGGSLKDIANAIQTLNR